MVPTVFVLHPPPGGVDAPITLPVLPVKGAAAQRQVANNNEGMNAGSTGAAIVDSSAAAGGGNTTVGATAAAATAVASSGKPTNATPTAATPHHGQGEKAGGFATRLINNVQKHLSIGDAITGTLTVSLELFEYGDEEQGSKLGAGLREPGAPRAPAGYSAAKFKVAEDAAEATRRREREGILVPQMLSRVQALHDRLRGGVI